MSNGGERRTTKPIVGPPRTTKASFYANVAIASDHNTTYAPNPFTYHCERIMRRVSQTTAALLIFDTTRPTDISVTK